VSDVCCGIECPCEGPGAKIGEVASCFPALVPVAGGAQEGGSEFTTCDALRRLAAFNVSRPHVPTCSQRKILSMCRDVDDSLIAFSRGARYDSL
jgi:hypothetical protein